MTVYIDVLFAINFSMDFLALFLTNLILFKKIHKVRILIASLIGGLYGTLEFFVDLNFMWTIVSNIAVTFLMCTIAFEKSKLSKYLSTLIIFWGVSSTLGGIMTLLYNLINKFFYTYIENYTYEEIYTGARFFIVVSLSLLFALLLNKIFFTRKEKEELDVVIEYNGTVFKTKGICDSGNLLKEPFTGKSVILVDKNSLIGKLIEKEREVKKKYIPYHTINSNGVLKGIVPNRIIIDNSEVSAVVAPVENISSNGFDAIVPSSLI